MTTPIALKDCPSCGSRIPEPDARCSGCASELDHCTGCGAWLVVGTECWDCGKSTQVRHRKASPMGVAVDPAGASARAASMQFDGSPLALIPLLALRFALFAGFLGAVVLALAAIPVPAVARLVGEQTTLPKPGMMPYLWGAAGGLLLLSGFAGALLRRYRLSHTLLLGKPLASQLTAGGVLLDLVVTLLVLGLTGGLGLPWIYARYRRSLYRTFRITARGTSTLDFQGTGEEVIARLFLTLLLFPLGVVTGGLFLGVLSWMWLKWDHGNMLIPDRHGQKRSPKFTGTFGAYYGRWLLGWILTLATAGLYRGWAKASEWRWTASHTAVL